MFDFFTNGYEFITEVYQWIGSLPTMVHVGAAYTGVSFGIIIGVCSRVADRQN